MDSTQRTRPRGGGSPVALVVFIILTVILAVLSYWGFAEYKTADRVAKEAIANEEKAKRDLKTANSDLEALQAAAGAQTPEALNQYVETALNKTKSLGVGSEAQLTAAEALRMSVGVMEALRAAVTKLAIDNNDLMTQLESLGKQKSASDAAYEEEVARLQSEITALNKQIDDVKADMTAKLDKAIKEREDAKTEYYQALEAWRDREDDYILKVAELQYRIRGLTGETAVVERADGTILDINQITKKVSIDIGSDRGVKPGMRFVIFTMDARDRPVHKGTMEILSVEPTVSVAQVLSVRADQAVGKGDSIYNLAGPEKQLFVFAGAPERYSIDQWTNFIRANGGEVVTDVRLGDQVADYLIMCVFSADDPRVADLIRDAQDFNLKIIKETDLVEAMGLI